MKLDPSTEARFWAKVEKRGGDDCWPWTACVDSSGYGCFGVAGRVSMASHVALVLDGKPRPPAPANYALHACDNPICVNPTHLRWGTQQENVNDRSERRGRYQRGPASHRARAVRLTEDVVIQILRSPELGKDIAAQLGVHKATVSDIRCGKTWRHLSAAVS